MTEMLTSLCYCVTSLCICGMVYLISRELREIRNTVEIMFYRARETQKTVSRIEELINELKETKTTPKQINE